MSTESFTFRSVASDVFVSESAEWMGKHIKESISVFGTCIVGLSGGSTPGPIYEQLGKDPLIDWSKVFVFLVDERYINENDKESNTRLVKTTLLKHAAIPDIHFIYPNTVLPLEDCIRDYEERINKLLENRNADLLTLGLGTDGHIASLFPPVIKEAFNDKKTVIHTTTSQFPVYNRISITMRIIQHAHLKLFLLKGKEKLDLWQSMIADPNMDETRWPAKSVLFHSKNTFIIVG